jgi:hypothetical protein
LGTIVYSARGTYKRAANFSVDEVFPSKYFTRPFPQMNASRITKTTRLFYFVCFFYCAKCFFYYVRYTVFLQVGEQYMFTSLS